ncbi:MAG: hypothetical protein HPPSJP_0900 [Candidatus Hepatoplasma scabrum]|nr:MAG: hypothetical protein HPPSJP_0900 [Candidatus Hepatoplasma sp.]
MNKKDNKYVKFELSIEKELREINKKEIGFFIKSPTPIKKVIKKKEEKYIYYQKALCDFIGIFNKKFILLELKDISGNSFEIRRLKEHQINQLIKINKLGGKSFILFRLKKENNLIIIVKIFDYLNFTEFNNKKSISIQKIKKIGYKTNINEFASFFIQLIN